MPAKRISTLSAPATARPDLHVDGTIESERLHDVVSIERPANAADNTSINVYRLADGGTRAVRTPIRRGRGSIDRVEVLAGLGSRRPSAVAASPKRSNA
jgi:hypothetical protein